MQLTTRQRGGQQKSQNGSAGPPQPIRTPMDSRPRTNRSKKGKQSMSIGIVFLVLVLTLFGMMFFLVFRLDYHTKAGQEPVGGIINTNRHLQNTNNDNDSNNKRQQERSTTNKLSLSLSSLSRDSIDAVRNEFYHRYGGKNDAEKLLKRGIRTYSNSETTSTTERILQNIAMGTGNDSDSSNNKFVITFAGYSVTVGRGNYFHQSYPFVIQNILKNVFKESLGLSLEVRNSAIGGIPSFPYGWCLSHFLGDDADIISWDYSMNEGNTASILESYIRYGVSQLRKGAPSMIIMLDNNKARSNLVQTYKSKSIIPHTDVISVSKASDNIVDKSILELPDSDKNKPEGFKEWNEFGAPKNCPGRGSWHPKKKEHELIGWMIAMHLLESIEHAYNIITSSEDDNSWKQQYSSSSSSTDKRKEFPPPINKPPPNNDLSVTQLLYGHNTKKDDTGGKDDYFPSYVMKDVSCRTSFLPSAETALNNDNDKGQLPSIVVSGLSPNIENVDIMNDRSDKMYSSGWVLDVSKVERDTKKKVEKCGGLGYIDMKIALYGIPQSGTLKLWLPYEGPIHNHDHEKEEDHYLDANHWFDDIVICEANEKRDDKACKLDVDLQYVVGGVTVDAVSSIAGAGEYLKRRTCYNIKIPSTSKVSKLKDIVAAEEGTSASSEIKTRLLGGRRRKGDGDDDVENNDDNIVGLSVDINVVRSDVSRTSGACCISHIVWENH